MTVRQYGTIIESIAKDHVERYRFAAKHLYGLILDGACGCGYGSRILEDAGNIVVGVDISPQAIEFAKQHWPGPQYWCEDLETYTPTGPLDGIVCFETIEHLSRPKQVLQTYREYCHGLLIASVPNQNVFPFKEEDYPHEYPHLRHYTPDEFEELLENCDFEVISRHSQKSKKEPNVVDGTDGRFLLYVCR